MSRPSSPPSPGRAPSPPSRPDPKHKGEVAELCFAHRATRLGLVVSKPYGDTAPYDFVVEGGGALRRVQVRSAWSHDLWGSYQVTATHRANGQRAYTSAQIEVLAAYLVPENTWYLIPIDALLGRKTFHLGGRDRLLERYRELWSILTSPRSRRAPR
ncbi:MAG: group I intron-associated PD-(D/E)XK endonuclease [Terriglobales bacterium]